MTNNIIDIRRWREQKRFQAEQEALKAGKRLTVPQAIVGGASLAALLLTVSYFLGSTKNQYEDMIELGAKVDRLKPQTTTTTVDGKEVIMVKTKDGFRLYVEKKRPTSARGFQ